MANEVAIPLLQDVVMQSLPASLARSAEKVGSGRYLERLTAPALVIEQAKLWASRAREAVAGATNEQRGVLLLSLLDHCVVKSDHVLNTGNVRLIANFWAAYNEDLSHVPVTVLQGACKRWRSRPLAVGSVRWFPAPGDLLALCREDEDWRRALAIRHGIERLARAEPEPVVVPLTDEEKAAIDARIEAWKARNRV